MVVDVRLALVLLVEILVGIVGVAEGGVVVLVIVSRAQVHEPAGRIVVVVRHVVMGVVVGQSRMIVLFKGVMIRHVGASTHIDFTPSTQG